jgi:hypothetical protein
MTEPSDLEVSHAYTRQAVEEYVKGVERQRVELQAAIEHARARTERAVDLRGRIDSLEHRIGESILTAHAQAGVASDLGVRQDRPTSLWSSSAALEQDRD